MRFSPWAFTFWLRALRFLVRITMFSRSMVGFEIFVKSLSETMSAFASECSMIMSSSSVVKSGNMGTATMPAVVTAR